MTAARKAPLSTGFSRQESWSGVPSPPPGGLPHPGIEPAALMSPALQAGSLPRVPPAKPKLTLCRFPKLVPTLSLSPSLPACPALSRPSLLGSAQQRDPAHLHPPAPKLGVAGSLSLFSFFSLPLPCTNSLVLCPLCFEHVEIIHVGFSRMFLAKVDREREMSLEV